MRIILFFNSRFVFKTIPIFNLVVVILLCFVILKMCSINFVWFYENGRWRRRGFVVGLDWKVAKIWFDVLLRSKAGGDWRLEHGNTTRVTMCRRLLGGRLLLAVLTPTFLSSTWTHRTRLLFPLQATDAITVTEILSGCNNIGQLYFFFRLQN